MALKQFTIDFAELAEEITLRFDVDFVDFNRATKDKIITFKELFFIELSEKKERTSLLDELENKDFYYCEIGNATKQGDLEPVKLNFEDRNELNENYFTKIEKGDIQRAFDGDILLSKVRPNLKKYILVDDEYRNYFFTTAFIRLRPKKLNKILYYSLRSIFYKNLMAVAREGKGYPTLKEDDLYYLKFDKNIIEKLESQQDTIVAQIEPIEKEIKHLKSQLKDPQEIINKVFAREFGFDENLYKEFGKGMTAGTQIAPSRKLRVFETDFQEFATSNILRFSTRFHNPPTKKLMHILDNLGTLKVKDILLEPIHRGVSPKYNPDGEIPVIKTGHLKNGYIEISQEEFVDSGFYRSSIRSQVKQGDILIASTGKVSLGKIDLLEEDRDLVADSHISIIRINGKKYSRQFFTYFFRSILGYFQVERDFTGATNQIELYANEISNFKIPNIPLSQQQKIVDKVKAELDEQEKIKAKNQNLRDKIDQIIEKAIQN